MINGGVEAGPNAVLAFAREGYKKSNINIIDLYDSLSYRGLQKFILKYPITSTEEFIRSLSKRVFVRSLQKLIPDIRSNMLTKASAGIRAQLMNVEGGLEQDFDIKIRKNIISVLLIKSTSFNLSMSCSTNAV